MNSEFYWCSNEEFLKPFIKEGTTFLNQNSSVDHLILGPFENKFMDFVAYFKTSILICNLALSIIGVHAVA